MTYGIRWNYHCKYSKRNAGCPPWRTDRKIAQPEADELLLTVKAPSGQRRLYISASASLPLVYLTDENKPSPFTAPNFCMLLRKHISNGRIVSITQRLLSGLSCLESSIWMSLEISAVRNLSLRSWQTQQRHFL